jgi:hypothetical protein
MYCWEQLMFWNEEMNLLLYSLTLNEMTYSLLLNLLDKISIIIRYLMSLIIFDVFSIPILERYLDNIFWEINQYINCKILSLLILSLKCKISSAFILIISIVLRYTADNVWDIFSLITSIMESYCWNIVFQSFSNWTFF